MRVNKEFENRIVDKLLKMLNLSVCNFMAVDTVRNVLEDAGFRELKESDDWNVRAGDKCYVIKNGSAIFAFVAGMEPVESAGVRIIAAHTDSPCFKIKPNCEIYGDGGVVSLNVEKYGGCIMSTWFDRPLSIAGRVMVSGPEPLHPVSLLVDLDAPVATIPNLAIHFNRQVNDGYKLSVQKDLKPVVGFFSDKEIEAFKADGGVIKSIIAEDIKENYDNIPDDFCGKDILDYELTLYPFEDAVLTGINQEYIQSARIDDLSMVFAALEALVSSCDNLCKATRVVAFFDNEETGSGTKQGAASPVLRHLIERLCLSLSQNPQAIYRALANSFMISADDAHGWHPNYNDKYDPTNHPVLGGGPVCKINANCKYMTDGRGAAVFHALCEKAGVTMQYFVNHADVAGGSTLGNISSAQLDIDGVDVGNAIWAMHSACETAAVSDHIDMIKVFAEFFK